MKHCFSYLWYRYHVHRNARDRQTRHASCTVCYSHSLANNFILLGVFCSQLESDRKLFLSLLRKGDICQQPQTNIRRYKHPLPYVGHSLCLSTPPYSLSSLLKATRSEREKLIKCIPFLFLAMFCHTIFLFSKTKKTPQNYLLFFDNQFTSTFIHIFTS